MNDERYTPFEWRRVDAGRIVSPDIRAHFDAWISGADGGIPKWSTGILEGLPSRALSFANVIDIGSGKPPFSYRFFGSGLADMHTFELTGKTTDAIEPEGFQNLCVDQHLLTVAERTPLVFANQIPTRRPGLFLDQTMVRLPYSDGSRAVTQILTLEEMEGTPRETWERFRAG